MDLEHVTLAVRPDETAAFEQDFVRARKIVAQAENCGGASLAVAPDGGYMLLIRWQSAPRDTASFRASDLYTQWRQVIHHYIVSSSPATYYRLVD